MLKQEKFAINLPRRPGKQCTEFPLNSKPLSECSEIEQTLLNEAAKVRLNAQAPYSNLYVGAAILSESGAIHVGCNVERCDFASTSHAEQNAIDTMVAQEGPSKVQCVAVIAGSSNYRTQVSFLERIKTIPFSCGHCLQLIWENCFCDSDVKIISLLADGKVSTTTIGESMPFRFGPCHINMDYNRIYK